MSQATTQTYNPTFFQKLLGRNYKWWYLVKFNLLYDYKLGNAFYFWLVSNLINVLGIMYVWNNIVKNSDLVLYALVSSIFARIIGSWIQWVVADNINYGQLNVHLLRPFSLLKLYLVMSFSKPIIESGIFIICIIVSSWLFYGNTFRFEYFIALPFLLIGLWINYLCTYIVGLIAFWERNYHAFINVSLTIIPILSGAFIPLNLLPFSYFLNLNPFAFVFYHPTEIALGKYSPLETFYVFLGGITWCIILYFLAKWVFKMGLKKNEAVGL